MSGKGKEVTGSRNFNKTIYVCIDCGEETSICFIDWGSGNRKDSPLCKECYMKRKEKYQGVGA